jgi:hypothetical protein
LGAGHFANCLGLIGKTDQTLQIVVEHAFANESASPAPNFEQTSAYQAAEGFVGRGAASGKLFRNLSFRQKFSSWRKMAAADEFVQRFDDLLMECAGAGHFST